MFVLKIPTETMVTYAFEYMGVSENSLDFWVPYFQTNPYTVVITVCNGDRNG